MSFMLENRQVNEINNKDKEDFFFFKMKEDYSFKYVPESHFKHVVKNVQRQRRKEDEERIWASFVKEQELNSPRFNEKGVCLSIKNVKGFIHENMQNVDRELKRLEEDALPERNKGVYNHKYNTGNENYYTIDKDVSVRGTNTVVQLPQEDNVPDHKQSEDPNNVVSRFRPKKSVSDPSIMQKKRCTNRLLRATDHFENNSDSDSSNNRHDIVHMQPDPVTTQKILTMRKKMIELLNEISFRLHRIPLPDGDNDLRRRQQQTMEFAIRFSRNYLYDLNRLLGSIQRHMNIISYRTEMKHQRNIVFHQDTIKHKLIAAHQLLIQALNAYCKHIPNSVKDDYPTKLDEVIQVVCNLRDIFNKAEVSSNYFCSGDTNILPAEDIQDQLNIILSKLKTSLKCKHQLIKNKSIESATTVASVASHKKKPLSKKSVSGRLSMYHVDIHKNERKKIIYKRKNVSYPKGKKGNVINGDSICSQHYSIPELLYPSPVTHASSSRDVIQIESMKSQSCTMEDEIRTMMDRVSINSDNERSSVEMWRKSNITMENERDTKLEDTANDDNLIKRVTTITKEHLSSLVPIISDLMTLMSKTQSANKQQPGAATSMETLMEFLQKYQSPKDSDTKENSPENSDEFSRDKLNGLSEIQKNGENVRLICMSSMDKVPRSGHKQCDASCQADYESAVDTTNSKSAVASKAKDGIELFVSRETEQQFLAYKREYKKLCQSKPMYSSNTQNKPWDIVAWISDKLIEELILEITKELQMNDVIKTMFEMEFQEF